MADFLATYLLHSTVILALTLVVLRLQGFRSAVVRDTVLRVALLAGLFTAALAPLQRPAVAVALPVMTPNRSAVVEQTRITEGHDLAVSAGKRDTAAGQAVPAKPLLDWAALLLLGSAAFTVIRFGAAWVVVRRASLGRVNDPDLQRRVQRLLAGRPVDVVWTRLRVPCATLTRQILLPLDIRQRLSPAELDAVLAHECAHLRRRDPLWNLALSFLTQLLWFQPLNWLALREWRGASEECCDAWASQRASRLSLAQAILTLARQVRPHGASTLLTSPAVRGTALSGRIHALLDPKETPMKRRPLILLAILPTLLGALTPPLALASARPMTVVLDAAHGGNNLGAVGLVRESDLVLVIARKVRARLEQQGVRVVMTRSDDAEVSLQERVGRIPADADAFVSIHANLSENAADRGVLTYGASEGSSNPAFGKSLKLAQTVQAAVIASTGA